MKHQPPRPPTEAVPDNVCAKLFTGGRPNPQAVVLLERMLAANAGHMVLSEAEAQAVDRFVLVTQTQLAAALYSKDRGRKVVRDRVLEASGDAATLVVLWRIRRGRTPYAYGVQIARRVDGVLTMLTPARGLEEQQAHALWHHTLLPPSIPSSPPIRHAE